jgi:hypothetical protein
MVNLSPSARLITAGAGAAFMAVLASPLAQADVGGAYSDISTIYGDAVTFAGAFAPVEPEVFYSDLAQPYNLFSASGIDLGQDPFPSDATATSDLGAIATEGTKLASDLNGLVYVEFPPITAATDSKELPLIAEAFTFQDQINQSIAFLPTITAQDETNPLLIGDLSALYTNELNLDNIVVNLGEQLANGSPTGITDANASIIADGLGIANDLQSTSETLTILADLTSLGL